MKVLILIPARGGSKGLPGKNLRTVAGISLVGRAARVGRAFLAKQGLTGTVLIDTDSQEIADEAVRWGAEAPFLRPPALAADATPMIDNVLHAADRLGSHDVVVLLQPTSPLRVVEDVIATWQAFDPAVGSAIAVVSPDHAPEQTLRAGAKGEYAWAWPELLPDGRRQDLPKAFRPSGSVYVSTLESLTTNRTFFVSGRTRAVALPRERSIDVDTAEDLAVVEALAARAPVRRWRLGSHEAGPGHPCFLIAEAGVNHNGKVDLAHKLIDVAADAHADAVKFQTFDPKRLVSPKAAMAEYQVANTGITRSQMEMLAELVLPREAHAELVKHAADRKILFLSSPFDEDSADFLQKLGVPAFKIASGELTNHPLLAHVARFGRPMLVSSGMADMVDVDRALEVIAANGNPDVALFHCVTSYPSAPADSNLRAMASMQASFGLPTGWSDHSEGITLPVAAVAMGACLVEKHFTLARTLPGPDHKASLEPGELAEMVRAIRVVEAARGDGLKVPRPAEIPLRAAARKSLHASRDLPVGHVIAAGDLIALRPGTGVSPVRLATILGRKLARAIGSGDLLEEAHLG